MEESKKGHNLVDISLNSLKSKSSRLNIDLNPYENIRILPQAVLKLSC